MRPFSENNLTPEEENFNKRISHARMTIENTFRILASRWRVLRNHIHALPENVDKIIKVTVLLHNFLMLQKCASYCPTNYADSIVNGDVVAGQWRNGNNDRINSIPASRAHNATSESYNLRKKLSFYPSSKLCPKTHRGRHILVTFF